MMAHSQTYWEARRRNGALEAMPRRAGQPRRTWSPGLPFSLCDPSPGALARAVLTPTSLLPPARARYDVTTTEDDDPTVALDDRVVFSFSLLW